MRYAVRVKRVDRVPDGQVHAEMVRSIRSNKGCLELTSTVETGQVALWLCSSAAASAARVSEADDCCADDGFSGCTSSHITLVAAPSNSSSTDSAINSLQVRHGLASSMMRATFRIGDREHCVFVAPGRNSDLYLYELKLYRSHTQSAYVMLLKAKHETSTGERKVDSCKRMR